MAELKPFFIDYLVKCGQIAYLRYDQNVRPRINPIRICIKNSCVERRNEGGDKLNFAVIVNFLWFA